MPGPIVLVLERVTAEGAFEDPLLRVYFFPDGLRLPRSLCDAGAFGSS